MRCAQTLVLLDTNAYLRFAKRVRPILGVAFGQKNYVLTILKDVETEVHRNGALRFKYPWFDSEEVAAERHRAAAGLNAPHFLDHDRVVTAPRLDHETGTGAAARRRRRWRRRPRSWG